MNRRINYLSQVLAEMRDRFGSEDSLVLQIQETLEHAKTMESVRVDARMPFGERRSARVQPSYWSVRLRTPQKHMTHRDILAQCQRVELRTLN